MTRPLSDDLRRCRIRPCVSGICSKGGGARVHGRKRQARNRGQSGENHRRPVSRQRDWRPLDRSDRLYAARTRQAALETRPSGVPSRSVWRNPNTSNAGAITPTPTDRSPSGTHCREYQLTATAGGRTGQAHGSAWRVPARGETPLSRPRAGCTRHDPEDAQRLILPASPLKCAR